MPLKDALFPSRSSIILRPHTVETVKLTSADEAVTAEASAPVAAQDARKCRRRSSFSDVDEALMRTQEKRRTQGVEYLRVRRNDLIGGSIGDMMNLKIFGSSRSLISMTSSIADSVPLETVQRRKTNKISNVSFVDSSIKSG